MGSSIKQNTPYLDVEVVSCEDQLEQSALVNLQQTDKLIILFCSEYY